MARQSKKSTQSSGALYAGENRFRTLIAHNADGLLIIDREGCIQFANPAVEVLFGRSTEELRGATFGFPLVAGETTEIEVLHPHSGFCAAEMRVAETLWDGERMFLASLRDVTERKRLEDEARMEARVSSTLVEVGRTLAVLLDVPTMLQRLCQLTTETLRCNWSHTFLWNPQEETYTLTAAYDGDRRKNSSARKPELSYTALSVLARRLEREDVILATELPADLRKLLGREAGIYLALRRGSRLIGMQSAGFLDSAQTFSQEQQRIAQGIAQVASLALANTSLLRELQQANQFKTDFLALISHELRTPISVVLGYVQLLLDGEFGKIKAEQAEVLRRIGHNTRSLLNLVSMTLDASLLESRRDPVEIGKVNLADLLGQLELETVKLRHKSQLRFEWGVEAQHKEIHTDRAKLKLILKHLVDNAMKFTEKGTVRVFARPHGGGMDILVMDTGTGIPKEKLSGIFEAFQQGADPLQRQHEGLGLGLYVVRRTAELLGGTVTIESTSSEGTIFRLWIPDHAGGAEPLLGRSEWGSMSQDSI